jgi:hypothetical protein
VGVNVPKKGGIGLRTGLVGGSLAAGFILLLFFVGPYHLSEQSALGLGSKDTVTRRVALDDASVLLVKRASGYNIEILDQQWLLWRHFGVAELDEPNEADPITIVSRWSATGEQGKGILAFAGLTSDPRVVRVEAGGTVASVDPEGQFLVAWVANSPLAYAPAKALGADGQVLYRLDSSSNYLWKPYRSASP